MSLILPIPADGSQPNEETKDDVQVIELNGASYNLNENGDALNTDGTVFKTKAELEAKPSDDNKNTPDDDVNEIEVDGVTYKLNETGDAVDNNGTVVLTKEKITELQNNQGNDEIGSIDDIVKLVNVVPVDESDKPIVYENSVDGIASYIKDVTTLAEQNAELEAEAKFFERNPDLYQVYLHKLNTGTIEGFGEQIDYSGVDVEKASEEGLINLIVANEIRTGKTREAAEYYAKLIKADGKLKEFATTAKDDLVTANTNYEQNALAIKQQQELEEAEAERKYWDKVVGAVKGGKLVLGDKSYKLPQVFKIKTADNKVVTATNDDFLQYITKPKVYTIEGQQYQMTPNQYDKYLEDNKKTEHDEIYEALKRFVRYDTSQFIEEQVKQETRKKIIISTKNTTGRGSTLDTGGAKRIITPVK